ncbi:hypothetical protein BG006_010654, partial [Podila minutissima]
RTAFTLPYKRNTPEADALYWSWTHDDVDISEDNEHVQIAHVYNLRDLHDCSKYGDTLGQPLTILCSVDQATVVIGIVVGFLAMMESVLTVWSSLKALFRARRSSNKSGSAYDTNTPSKSDSLLSNKASAPHAGAVDVNK